MPKPLIKRFLSGVAAVFSSWQGAYTSTDPRNKLMNDWRPMRATANQALAYNIPKLVAQCRHLERSTTIGRAIVEGLKADIVGTGIGIEPDTGDEGLNEKLVDEFQKWADHACLDGRSLWELQYQSPGELACGGCVLWRWMIAPERQKLGLLPLCIVPLEPEWFAFAPVAPLADGTTFVAGVEVDKFNRPVAYHFIDPTFATLQQGYGKGERVPANEIMHGFEARRPFQSHGEPWMAPVVERIKQIEDLVAIELRAAANTAAVAVAVTAEYHPDEIDDANADVPEAVTDLSPGVVARLFPGEDIKTIENHRPSQLIEPFVRMMQNDIAGACRVPVKWLRRDYSGATFMNSRIEQADATRQHKSTQIWLGRFIASEAYFRVFPWLMLRLGKTVPNDPRIMRELMKHTLMPDRPEYVDPVKDGEGAVQNVRNNLSTLADECASRGKDWRQIIKQRQIENKALDAAGLTIEDPAVAAKADQAAAADKSKKPKKSDSKKQDSSK